MLGGGGGAGCCLGEAGCLSAQANTLSSTTFFKPCDIAYPLHASARRPPSLPPASYAPHPLLSHCLVSLKPP